MKPAPACKPDPRVPFRVGDRVRFHFVDRPVEGTIVEDRGPLAKGGQRLFRIEFEVDVNATSFIELPVDRLQAINSRA
jgi:hypothetical protein